MGIFGGSSRNKGSANRDTFSRDDYDYVQDKFREMYNQQQSGNNQKAQELWDQFRDEAKKRK